MFLGLSVPLHCACLTHFPLLTEATGTADRLHVRRKVMMHGENIKGEHVQYVSHIYLLCNSSFAVFAQIFSIALKKGSD